MLQVERLAAAAVDSVIPVSHGNAWSLYFTDPEGNGLECFVDSPFHVAQPYAGEDGGMHFPLLKGTEVILTHVDGDPDRPIIVGSPPNGENTSPITQVSMPRPRRCAEAASTDSAGTTASPPPSTRPTRAPRLRLQAAARRSFQVPPAHAGYPARPASHSST